MPRALCRCCERVPQLWLRSWRSPARYCRFSIKAIYRLHRSLIIGGLSLFLQAMPLIPYLCALVGAPWLPAHVFGYFAPRIAQCSEKPTASVFAIGVLNVLARLHRVPSARKIAMADKLMASIDTMGSIVVIAIVILMIAYLFIFFRKRFTTRNGRRHAPIEVPHQKSIPHQMPISYRTLRKSTICRHVKPRCLCCWPEGGTLDTFKRRSTFQREPYPPSSAHIQKARHSYKTRTFRPHRIEKESPSFPPSKPVRYLMRGRNKRNSHRFSRY